MWLDRNLLRWVGRVWLLLGAALLLTFVFREELKISVLLNESMRETKPFGWNDVSAHFVSDFEKTQHVHEILESFIVTNFCRHMLLLFHFILDEIFFELSMPVRFCATTTG